MATYRELQKENNKIVPIPEDYNILPNRNTSRANNLDFSDILRLSNASITPEYIDYSRQATEVGFGESKYDRLLTDYSQLKNLNEIRASNQTTIDKWLNATVKMGTLALTTFVDGFLGTAYGLINMGVQAASGNVQSGGDLLNAFVDNPVSSFLQGVNNYMEEAMPNYYTEAEQNMPWYTKLGTANFWADGVLKNAGFMIGTAFSAGTAGKVLTKATKLNKVRDLYKNLAITYDDVVKGGKALGSKAGILKAQDAALQSLKNRELTVKLGTGVLSSIGESRIEALNGKDEFVNGILPQLEYNKEVALQNIHNEIAQERPDLIEKVAVDTTTYDVEGNPLPGLRFEYRPKRGREAEYANIYNQKVDKINNDYTNAVIELNNQAQQYSNSAFALNTVVTGLTNMKLFGNAVLGNYKVAKQVNNVVKETSEKKLAKEGAALFKANKLAANMTRVSGIGVPLAESFQETSQKVITESMNTWYGNKYNTWYGSTVTPEEIDDQTTMLSTLYNTFVNVATDPKEWEDAFIGFVTALLPMPSIGTVSVKDKDGKVTPKRKLTFNNEMFSKFREAKEILAQGNASAQALNDLMNDEKKMAFVAGNIRAARIEKDKEKALEENDQLGYENALADDNFNTILTFIEAGQTQELYNWIDTAYTLDESGIESLKANTKVKDTEESPYDNMTDEEILSMFKDQKATIRKQAEDIVKIYNSVNTLYGESLSKEGKLEMTHLLTTLDHRNSRVEENTKKLLDFVNSNLNVIKEELGEEGIEELRSLQDLNIFLSREDINTITTLDTKKALKKIEGDYAKLKHKRQSLYGKQGSITAKIKKLESKVSDGTITEQEQKELSKLKAIVHPNSSRGRAIGRVLESIKEVEKTIDKVKNLSDSIDMSSVINALKKDLVDREKLAHSYKMLSSDPTILEESFGKDLERNYNYFKRKKAERVYNTFKSTKDFRVLSDSNVKLKDIKALAESKEDTDLLNWINRAEKLSAFFINQFGESIIPEGDVILNKIINDILNNSTVSDDSIYKELKTALERNKDAIIINHGEDYYNALITKLDSLIKVKDSKKESKKEKEGKEEKETQEAESKKTTTSLSQVKTKITNKINKGNTEEEDVLEVLSDIQDVDSEFYNSLISDLTEDEKINYEESEDSSDLFDFDTITFPENTNFKELLKEIRGSIGDYLNEKSGKNTIKGREKLTSSVETNTEKSTEPVQKQAAKKPTKEEGEVTAEIPENEITIPSQPIKKDSKPIKQVEEADVVVPSQLEDRVINVGTKGIIYNTKDLLDNTLSPYTIGNNVKSKILKAQRSQEFVDSGELAKLQDKYKNKGEKLPVRIISYGSGLSSYFLAVDVSDELAFKWHEKPLYRPDGNKKHYIQIIGDVKSEDLPESLKSKIRDKSKEENAPIVIDIDATTTLEYIFSGRLITNNKYSSDGLEGNVNRDLQEVLNVDGIEANDKGSYDEFDIVVTEQDGSISYSKTIGKEDLFEDDETISLNSKRYTAKGESIDRAGQVWLRSKAPDGRVYLKAIRVKEFYEELEEGETPKEGTVQRDIYDACEALLNAMNSGIEDDVIQSIIKLERHLYFDGIGGIFAKVGEYIRIGNHRLYAPSNVIDIYNFIASNSPVFNLPVTKNRQGIGAPSLQKLVESGIFVTNLASIYNYGASFVVSKIGEDNMRLVTAEEDFSNDFSYRLFWVHFEQDTGGYNSVKLPERNGFTYLFETDEDGNITELAKRKDEGDQNLIPLDEKEVILAKIRIYSSLDEESDIRHKLGISDVEYVRSKKGFLKEIKFKYKENINQATSQSFTYVLGKNTIEESIEGDFEELLTNADTGIVSKVNEVVEESTDDVSEDVDEDEEDTEDDIENNVTSKDSIDESSNVLERMYQSKLFKVNKETLFGHPTLGFIYASKVYDIIKDLDMSNLNEVLNTEEKFDDIESLIAKIEEIICSK